MKLILNDNIDCILTLYSKKTDIDGQRETVIANKKFKCSYSSTNSVSYNSEMVQTIAGGVVRINGDVAKGKEVYDGTCNIFGENHEVIKVNKCRNVLNSKIVDFTEIVIE